MAPGISPGYDDAKDGSEVWMVEFLQKRSAPSRRTTADDEVPEALARALDASAEDLREGRILDDFDSFIDEMEAELEAHLARERGMAR
jgi:hypothetical protein